MTSAAATAAPPVQKPDVKLIVPFVESIRDVFKTMLSTEVQMLKPYLKINGGDNDVFGIIGFSGDLVGSVALSFPRKAAEQIVEAFTGAHADHASPAFADAIGELANMVAGGAKSKLGLNASITVPNVVLGERCHVARLSDVPCLVIPCKTALGEFAVEVCIKQKVAA